MIEQFKEINFKPQSLRLIAKANAIVEQYQEDGFMLTIRQLYYQLVKANEILNDEKVYKNLINLISDARLAGLLDWAAIEVVGREQAEALKEADIKIISNTGTPSEGLTGVMDLFSTKGGMAVGGFLEALKNTETGKALITKALPNGAAESSLQ